MRSALALAAGALAGCHLVFPLEELPPGATVSGTYLERVVVNTPSGPVVTVRSAKDAVALRARFVVDSEVRLIDVPIDGDGNFVIERLAVDYSLESTFPTSPATAVPIELFDDQPTVQLALIRAGREDAVATESIEVGLPTPGPARNVVSIGQYSNTEVSGLLMFDWRNAKPTGGFELGLLHAEHDRLFVLDSSIGHFQDGQTAISAVGVAPNPTMTNGMRLDLGALNMVSQGFPDGCIDIDLDLTTSLTRLEVAAQSSNPAFDTPVGSVALVSVPAVETGLVAAVKLVDTTPVRNELVFRQPLEYADPFPSHAQFLTASAESARPLLGGPPSLGFRFVQTTPVERGACPATVSSGFMPIDIAYAVDVTLEGQALGADDVQIDVPRTGSVTVSWTAEGLADFFDVTLLEVDETTPPTLQPRRVFRTRATQVAFDSTLLVPGRAYVLVIASTVGFPGATTGDYATESYPSVVAGASTAVFRPN